LLLLTAVVGFASANEPVLPAHSTIDLAGMDTSVKPYEDFYQFANGKWLSTATIPADRPSIAMFTLLRDRNQEVLHQILEETAKGSTAPKSSPAGKVGAFYKSGMDETRIAEAGAKPLQEELDRIAAIKNAPGIVQAIARLHAKGVSAA